MKLVSIITVCYNDLNNLQKTVSSVMSQNFDDFEFIVVDGGSEDGTVKYLETQDGLKYISEQDNGISDAFNKGVKMANGQWIIFMGAGDIFINSNLLTSVKNEMISKKNHNLLWGNVFFINGSGEIGRHNICNFPKKTLKVYNCFHHQGVFHNRKLFAEVGEFDEKVRVAMDYDILLRGYNQIQDDGYLNLDISYVLVGGNSQIGNDAIKDFMQVQIKNNIWPKWISYSLFLWAYFKNNIKKLIMYNPYRV